jgi:hypothetical protein
MLNPDYIPNLKREIVKELHHSLAREQALIKLTEAEMWLSQARPKKEEPAS